MIKRGFPESGWHFASLHLKKKSGIREKYGSFFENRCLGAGPHNKWLLCYEGFLRVHFVFRNWKFVKNQNIYFKIYHILFILSLKFVKAYLKQMIRPISLSNLWLYWKILTKISWYSWQICNYNGNGCSISGINYLSSKTLPWLVSNFYAILDQS